MTPTWNVLHNAGGKAETTAVNADAVHTDQDNNLVLTDSAGPVAIFKNQSWYSVVREKPQPVTLFIVRRVSTPYWGDIERYAELII